ncbi:hypothetical protein ISCGN_029931 [Ixodes scapularis]
MARPFFFFLHEGAECAPPNEGNQRLKEGSCNSVIISIWGGDSEEQMPSGPESSAKKKGGRVVFAFQRRDKDGGSARAGNRVHLRFPGDHPATTATTATPRGRRSPKR